MLLLVAATITASAASAVPVTLDAALSGDGMLSLSVNGAPWLASGATALRQKATWFVSDCPASGKRPSTEPESDHMKCKPLVSKAGGAPTSGTDAVGAYAQKSVQWTGAGDASMIVGVRTYTGKPDVLGLVQSFPNGLEPRNNNGAFNEVVSAFPTFGSSARDLGVLFFDGVQLQDSRYFPWAAGTPIHSNDPGVPTRKGKPGGNSKDPKGNTEGGMPLLLVDSGSGASVVFSPLADFFTATQAESKALGNWSFGMQATLESAPKGHEHVTLVVAGASPRGAMMRWGDVFMGAAGAGKQRNMDWTENGDAGLKYLSYYTDNGAYYYYHTIEGYCSDKTGTPGHGCVSKTTPKGATGYVATLDALSKYFKEASLPIGALQYDSWWYYKGPNSGVQLWEPEPSTLGGDKVNGPPSSWYKPSVPTVTHSRYYEPGNDYVTLKAPGLPADASEWVWVSSGNESQLRSATGAGHPAAVSTSSGFFKHIYQRAQSGLGMVTYEQDFLTNSYESIPDLQSKVGLAKAWLTAMSDAAEETNVTVQYCMSLPRHILQSASFKRVTHARASHDYGQSQERNTQQWSELGLSATLYWALGILPFKDDFWSEMMEAGNTWGAKEADPELQTLVSSLSAGPVGPSDALQQVNVSRVMQTCRQDGTLLKPSAPAMQLDSTYTAALHRATVQDNGIAHIWHTVSSAKARSSGPAEHPHNHIILAANITRTTNISVVELKANAASIVSSFTGRADLDANSFLAREYYSGDVRQVSDDVPLMIAPQKLKPQECAGRGFTHEYCTPFELWTLTPTPTRQAHILLGEKGKYIGLSPQRFAAYSARFAELKVTVLGTKGERVTVEVAEASQSSALEVDCVIGATGTAALQCGASKCTCN
jgi:hypothetical protein